MLDEKGSHCCPRGWRQAGRHTGRQERERETVAAVLAAYPYGIRLPEPRPC